MGAGVEEDGGMGRPAMMVTSVAGTLQSARLWRTISNTLVDLGVFC